MGHLADRKVLTVAVAVTVSAATGFGLVGWFLYDSATVAVLSVVTVMVEGTVVILLGSRWDARQRRRGAHRRRGKSDVHPPARGGWVPDGWDLPWDERLRDPVDPSA